MHYVYIIRSQKNSRYYVGSTKDIERRLASHRCGHTKSLKNKGPFDLVRIEEFESKTEALKREHQIKRYKGGRAFKKLIA
jgi:putative endonuclease